MGRQRAIVPRTCIGTENESIIGHLNTWCVLVVNLMGATSTLAVWKWHPSPPQHPSVPYQPPATYAYVIPDNWSLYVKFVQSSFTSITIIKSIVTIWGPPRFSTRFVGKPEGDQQCFFDLFWLFCWGQYKLRGLIPSNHPPRHIQPVFWETLWPASKKSYVRIHTLGHIRSSPCTNVPSYSS